MTIDKVAPTMFQTKRELIQYSTKFSIDIPRKFTLEEVEQFRLSNLRKEALTAFIRGFSCHHHHHHYYHHQVVCLTTGPQPLPETVLHKGLSITSFSISCILPFPKGHPVAA